jgi:plasmid stabilization system protein ParE
MTPRFLFRPGAREEIREARRWYEAQAAGLGRRFLADLEAVFERLRTFPAMYPVVERTTAGIEVRRAVLARFPYMVTYLVADAGATIVVLACFHGRRDPADLEGRA